MPKTADSETTDSVANDVEPRFCLPVGYHTEYGTIHVGHVEELLDSQLGEDLTGTVQLIFTSPPFPLNRKKSYGNKVGAEYCEWLERLAPRLTELLTDDGSIVMELGNAWEPGKPVMSTLALRALLKFMDAGELHLCQQFICHNPARLPSPVQWVNVERIRVKDSFTHVWWMSPTERPKADNRKVLVPYSNAMKDLIRTGRYNGGMRPSGHNVGATSFAKDNGGAIPPSVLEMPEIDDLEVPQNVMAISNTTSTDAYRRFCREWAVEAHPAPMQPALAEFFIKMLTDGGDLVFDPFAGSNTTGAVAETLERQWVATEPNGDYVFGSQGRFVELRDDPMLTV